MAHMFVNTIGVMEGGAKNMFHGKTVVDIDPPANTDPYVLACSCDNMIGFANGQCLTLCTVPCFSEENVIDIEFDSDIRAMAWQSTASSLLVADSSGTLHLLSSSGQKIFSHKLIPAKSDSEVISMGFMEISGSSMSPSLICVIDNGCVIAVDALPIDSLREAVNSGSGIMEIMQKIKFSKCMTTYINPGKVLLYSLPGEDVGVGGGSVCGGVILDSHSAVHVVRYESLDSTVTVNLVESINDEVYSDMALVPVSSSRPASIVLLGISCGVTVVNLSSGEVLQHMTGEVPRSLLPGCDSIVLLETRGGDIILSLSSSEQEVASVLTCALVGTRAVVIDISNLPEECAPQRTIGMYPVGNRASDSCSHRVAYWKSNSEVAVVGYSEGVYATLEAMGGDSDANTEECDTATLLGRLMNSHISSNCAVDQVRKSFAYVSADEIMALLRCILLCTQLPLSEMRELMVSAQDCLERMTFTEHHCNEMQCLLTCCQTASEYDWREDRVQSSTEACQEHVDESNLERDVRQVSQFRDLLYGNASVAWEDCVKRGHLQASSAILHRHLGDVLPSEPDIALNLVKSDMCAPEEVVDWVKRDIVPALLLCSNTDSVLHVCTDLLRRASESERTTLRPFASVTASQLAVSISTSLLPADSVGSDSIIVAAERALEVYAMQSAFWTHWGMKVSSEDVSERGLSGVLSSRLKSSPERTISTDIDIHVRPLVQKYGGDTDMLLFEWVCDTLKSSVVMTADDSYEHVPSNDNDDLMETFVSVTRLVNVTSSIQTPNLRARAIISILQMLVIPKRTQRDDVDVDNVFDDLSRLSQEVSHLVSQSIADSLTEAFRSHKLRELVARYNIIGFDPRNARQVREAISVIVTKIDSESSVADALCFADAYASSAVDVNGILVKALVHRIVTSNSSGDDKPGYILRDFSGRDGILKNALAHIPTSRLHVVVEDTCEYLLSVVDDLCLREDESERKVGFLASPTDEEYFSNCVNGALYLCNYFLDSVGDKRSSVGENRDSKTASLTAQATMWTEYQNMLKRIRKLMSEFSLYLCPAELRDHSVCVSIATSVAVVKANELLLLLDSHVARSANGGVNMEDFVKHCTTIGSVRKLCTVLNISFVGALNSMIRHVLSNGNMELGMSIAEVLVTERKDISAMTSCPNVFQHSFMEKESSVKDGELVLNAAVIICGAAAKKETIQRRTEQYPRSSALKNIQQVSSVQSDAAPFALSGELLRLSVLTCSGSSLGKTVDLLNSCELVLDVHQRLETHVGKPPGVNIASNFEGSSVGSSSHIHGTQIAAHRGRTPATSGRATNVNAEHDSSDFSCGNQESINQVSLQQLQSQIGGTNFTRDGILLTPSVIWGPLLKHIVLETRRRENATSFGDARTVTATDDDVDKLVTILQRSENHMLAVRVLLSSWQCHTSKKQCLHASMMALSRKVLSYRDIDKTLAVACLSTVPYEAMVRELRSAVPSIQSDFSRLRTVAQIGEQLAQMWDQEELLLVFESLQTNAKWWHILSAHGVKIDPRAFQSSVPAQREACIRAVVPELLHKTRGDISLAMEYCSQYDLEAHYASICYIEYVLLLSPAGFHISRWSDDIKAACSSVEESLLVTSLQSILPKIHSLDYEKIRYTCTWMMGIINDEDLEQDNDTDPLDDSGIDSAIVCNEHEKNIAARIDLKEQCSKYLDIATLLSNLGVSVNMRKVYPNLALYENVPEEYTYRLPFWNLLHEPWSILEPLLSADAELAAKLTPICSYLNLDRDEFYIKRAMNIYSKRTSGLTAAIVDGVLEPQFRNVLSDVEDVVTYIKSPFNRVRIWRWVFDAAKDIHFDVASAALQTALGVFEDGVTVRLVGYGGEDLKRLDELKQEVVLDAVKHKCRADILQLDKEKTKLMTGQQLGCFFAPRLMPVLGDVSATLRALFEIAVEEAWIIQLDRLRRTQDVLCCLDIMKSTLVPAVCEYMSHVGNVAMSIHEHHSVLYPSHDQERSVVESIKSTTGLLASSALQSTRHSLIGKLLADAETHADATNRSVLSSTDKPTGSSQLASGWGAGSSSAWGTALESGVSPSAAEKRRREDVFRAFSISLLVMSCSDSCPRDVYINQLMIVGSGTGARVQRRLTARSKFRAIQALLFLNKSIRTLSLPGALSEEQKLCSAMLEDNLLLMKLKWYLYCLAELQELRLPCSEDTLALAVGYSPPVGGEVLPLQPANPCPLVNTWLHDEGHDPGVCELARDVLIAAECTDDRMCITLLTHMLQRGFTRAALHTVICVRKNTVVNAIFRDDYLGSEIVQMLLGVSGDVGDKIEQMLELFKAKENVNQDVNCGKENTISAPKVSSTSSAVYKPSCSSGNGVETLSASCGKRIMLLSLRSPWSSGAWEDCPEDVALTAERLQCIWRLLRNESFQHMENYAEKLQAACVRLLVNSCNLKQFPAPSPYQSPGSLRDSAVESMTSDAAFMAACSLVYHIRRCMENTSTTRSMALGTTRFLLEEFLVKLLHIASFGIDKERCDSLPLTQTESNRLDVKSLLRLLYCLCETIPGSDLQSVLSRYCMFRTTSETFTKTLDFECHELSATDIASSSTINKQFDSLLACMAACGEMLEADGAYCRVVWHTILSWLASSTQAMSYIYHVKSNLSEECRRQLKLAIEIFGTNYSTKNVNGNNILQVIEQLTA